MNIYKSLFYSNLAFNVKFYNLLYSNELPFFMQQSLYNFKITKAKTINRRLPVRVMQYPCQSGQSDRAACGRRKLCRTVSINGLFRCICHLGECQSLLSPARWILDKSGGKA